MCGQARRGLVRGTGLLTLLWYSDGPRGRGGAGGKLVFECKVSMVERERL